MQEFPDGLIDVKLSGPKGGNHFDITAGDFQLHGVPTDVYFFFNSGLKLADCCVPGPLPRVRHNFSTYASA